MDTKKRRELYRQELAKRHQESYATKDDTGRFRDIFDPEKKSGVSFWKCNEDDHDIYIVPYITGKQHPRLKEGKVAFTVDVFVHRGIGVNEDSFICLNRSYNKRCPICEYQAELRESDSKDADEQTIKSLNATRRSIFNIVCLDSAKEKGKGVQVWDVSHWLFTIPLEELAHKKRGGGSIAYADIDEGKVISFRKKGSKRNTEYTAFEFKDREVIPEEFLDGAHCLDDLLHIPSYEEVHQAFWEAKEGEGISPETQEDAELESESISKQNEQPEPEKKLTPRSTIAKEDVPEFDECPAGAVFGTDYNEYDNCQDCEARKACRNKRDELDEIEERKKVSEKKGEIAPERKRLVRRDK
jgi:uncharacterized Zn finger protein (UPF0148 family)